MKRIFELVFRLARGRGAVTVSIAGLATATAAAQGSGYTVQFGSGTAPFVDDSPSSSYSVSATGIQNQQGVHGFVTHHNGTDTYVNMPGENYYIAGLHIDNSGQVCGTYNANYGGYGCTSFFWSDGQLNLLHSTGTFGDPHVHDMNDFGTVVGDFSNYSYRQGFILDHGILSNFSLSSYGSFNFGGATHNLAGSFATINGINNGGQLYGDVLLQNNESYWYIATPLVAPIPEPSAVALLSAGLFGAIALRRRRK